MPPSDASILDQGVAPPRFDPLDPEVLADPYAAYAHLRREMPVAYLDEHDVWVVSRHADVVRLLREPAVFSSELGMGVPLGESGADADSRTGVGYRIGARGVRVLIATDPPDHRVFRQAVADLFSPKAIRAYTPLMHEIAHDLIDRLIAAEPSDADFTTLVAQPYPALVLAEIFGVPADMRADFLRWALLVTSDLDQRAEVNPLGVGLEMFRYFRQELRARRGEEEAPGLLGRIANLDSDVLSDHELLAFCAFLLVAGIETTSNLLSNIVEVLGTHADVQAQARADRDHSMNRLIEETLRFDSPVQALWRATTEETELGGVVLPAEARLLVLFGSANRDEAVFAYGDEFVLDRDDGDHLGFGFGPHYCLGARLARKEVGIVLGTLFDRTSGLTLRPGSQRLATPVLRGFQHQPVALEMAE